MSRPWMPIYWGDYLADTQHLSLEEHGAYLLLIAHYWARGGLPSDHASLKRILGLHSKSGESRWRSICLAIAPFFDENWRHKRIDEEIARAENIKLKRQLAGAKGGRLSRERNNLARMVNSVPSKQMLKQMGGIHSSTYNSFLSGTARTRAHAREAVPQDRPSPAEPQQGAVQGEKTGNGLVSQELQQLLQAKGWTNGQG